jgi:hypothetical protein
MGGVKGAFTKVIGMAKDQGMIKEVKKEEPKQEETKQAEEKEASETKRLLRVKRKGRSATVLSSSSGVTDEASVSKKTLLGS